MTDMIDKNLRQFRPRPEARRDEPAGFPATFAVIGLAGATYMTLAIFKAVRLMWGW